MEGVKNPLNSKIKPHESRGYICWDTVPGAKYVVSIFEQDLVGSINLIGIKSTDKNYTRLDLSYISNPKIYYSISAFNKESGYLIGTGDVFPAPPGGLGDEICLTKCVGKTYAYQLSYITAPFNGPGEMALNSTVDHYNSTTGEVTPFWQPVSQAVYNQMNLISHPYDAVNSIGIFNYKHKQITI